jgi:hypothetical protein
MRAGLDSQQQRLRLSDFPHSGCRRKAFKRGREDGVGFGGAAGRLIEFLPDRERLIDQDCAAPCCSAAGRVMEKASSAAGLAGSCSADFTAKSTED